MPARNVNKIDIAESFYHVYARGVNKQKVFIDTQDYTYFLKLFDRYLSTKQAFSKTGVAYPHYRGKVEITAYCLMRNHFHLALYQIKQSSMKHFMQSVMTSYCKYFNLKYKRTGPVFESRYKASLIQDDAYLQHISRYIHLNPRFWQAHKYSSLKFYLDQQAPSWLRVDRMKNLFGDIDSYLDFVSDYEENKRWLDELKHQLADH